jgi:hypothetical protein
MEFVQSRILVMFAVLQECSVMCISFMQCIFYSGKYTDPLLNGSLKVMSLFGDTFDVTLNY